MIIVSGPCEPNLVSRLLRKTLIDNIWRLHHRVLLNSAVTLVREILRTRTLQYRPPVVILTS